MMYFFICSIFHELWKKFLAFAFKGNVPILLSLVELSSHSAVGFISFCFIFICSSFLCALFRRYRSLRSPLLNHLSLSLCLSIITSSQKKPYLTPVHSLFQVTLEFFNYPIPLFICILTKFA